MKKSEYKKAADATGAEVVDLRPTFRNTDEHGIWANTYWDIWECDNASDPAKLEAANKKACAVADALILRLQQRTPDKLNEGTDSSAALERSVDRFVQAFAAADERKIDRETLFRDAVLSTLRPLVEAMVKQYAGEPAPVPVDSALTYAVGAINTRDGRCRYSEFSSRTCEHGMNGCIVKHGGEPCPPPPEPPEPRGGKESKP